MTDVLAAVFADDERAAVEASLAGEDARLRFLPGVGFPRIANALLADPDLGETLVLTSGATFLPGAVAALVEPLSDRVWVTSAWESAGRRLRSISSLAFAIRRDRLRQIGGLDERLEAFWYEVVLADAVAAAGGLAVVVPEAGVAIHGNKARLDALAGLYYVQMRDHEIATGRAG